MRIVLDSSILIAAAISRAGVCAQLLEDVLTHHELVTSEFILGELSRKLAEKFRFPRNEIRELRQFLERVAAVVVPASVPDNACRDPLDRAVLGTALAQNATLLISVDKDLLEVRDYQDIKIIRPGEFWRRSLG